jgi:hypothetical protein
MNMPRTVDIPLPLEQPPSERIRQMRAELERRRAERPTREAVRSLLASWVAETTHAQMVIR